MVITSFLQIRCFQQGMSYNISYDVERIILMMVPDQDKKFKKSTSRHILKLQNKKREKYKVARFK